MGHNSPSCYVPPGFGWKGSDDRESKEPTIYLPPLSLTIDEMIAIDTWLLKNEGEELPNVETMRTAYEKFLRLEDRPGSYDAIRLASLYDAKGDLDTAIHLLEANYTGVLKYDSGPSRHENLAPLRDDHRIFSNLKKQFDIVAKFPNLLQGNTQH